MKRIVTLLIFFATIPLLVACGTTVEVPPAYVGKLSTKSGLQSGIIQPSKLRLSDWCMTCDNLILAEASDYAIKEEMPIFMQADTLNLKVEVRGTVAISSDEENVEKVFARLPASPVENNDRISKIGMEKVYVTYAQPIIRETTRTIITKYNIKQVMENRDAIGQEIWQMVRDKLKTTPITMVQFGLADVQPPPVIVEAQEKAKGREIAIQQAEADKQVALKTAEAAYEVAVKQQSVDLKEAETQVLVEEKLSRSVNQAFIAQRSLRVLEEIAKSPNKVMFLPLEAFSNPALILGSVSSGLQESAPAARR
jgi:hypothetical protein